MTAEIQRHSWGDLSDVPEATGVYAWYFRPEITDFDLDRTIANVRSCRDHGDAERLVRSTLEKRLFDPFREEPYSASVVGALKPTYVGSLQHEFAASSGLVERIVDDPERLRTIRDVLSNSAPIFASPLYIGMASGLRTRLARHKELIERFRLGLSRDGAGSRMSSDAGFAWQIAKRQIPPERLLVFTCLTEGHEGVAVDVENILNRICYPILGRN